MTIDRDDPISLSPGITAYALRCDACGITVEGVVIEESPPRTEATEMEKMRFSDHFPVERGAEPPTTRIEGAVGRKIWQALEQLRFIDRGRRT